MFFSGVSGRGVKVGGVGVYCRFRCVPSSIRRESASSRYLLPCVRYSNGNHAFAVHVLTSLLAAYEHIESHFMHVSQEAVVKQLVTRNARSPALAHAYLFLPPSQLFKLARIDLN